MMFYSDHLEAANQLLEVFKKKKIKLATAESCTGGLISALLTDISGSSAVFSGGFIAYSNDLKVDLLGVDAQLIRDHGAVSDEVACAMAEGAVKKTGADFAVAVTGVAGPTGGTPHKPVGLVYIAIASKTNVICKKNNFVGSRSQIRSNAVSKALSMLLEVA